MFTNAKSEQATIEYSVLLTGDNNISYKIQDFDASKSGVLTQPRREYGSRSWADVLKDSGVSEQDKLAIIYDIVEDASCCAGNDGIELKDPRTILPS